MNQIEFDRRKLMAAAARAREFLKLWAPAVAMVGAQDCFDMEAQAGIAINAMTDNGGGMKDALASQGAIAELDVSRTPNWTNILPTLAR